MTQSEAPPATLSTTSSHIAPLQGLYDRAERRLRRISAWLILFFLLQGELGAVWDREWHAYVGRDQFWTPPHTLIYSCVSGAGLVALFFLLQGELGAVWDREWHAYVGRDQFWTPPHTLIYSCVSGAGLVALIVVL